MGQQGPKCTQMDEDTCQGFRGAGRNFFLFTIQAAATTFPEVILKFAARGPKFTWICCVQLISYFSLMFSTFFQHLLYSAQLWRTLQEWSFCTANAIFFCYITFFLLDEVIYKIATSLGTSRSDLQDLAHDPWSSRHLLHGSSTILNPPSRVGRFSTTEYDITVSYSCLVLAVQNSSIGYLVTRSPTGGTFTFDIQEQH